MLLRQSTAQTVVIGPVLDSTGAAVTTAVVTNFSLAKNGTAAALTTETLTHLGNGYYSLALTTSNTNTTGVLAAFPNATTMSMTVFRWNVISASVYDAIVTNATNTSGGLLTATSAVSAISGALLNTTNLPSNFVSLAITAGGAVTAGTVSDKTGYSLTQNFPSNFAALAIDVSGKVLLQATQTGVTIPTVTTVSGFATDSITAAALATDAVAEIQSGLSTLTQANVRSAVGLASANLDAQIAAIPAAVEAELDITVLPLDATVVDRVAGTTINLFTDETPSVAVAVVDSSGAAVDLTNLTLEVVIELRPSTDVAVIANANISKANGSFSFTVPSAVTNAARACKWALRKTSDSSVLVQGDLFVNYAPTNDA